MTAYATRYVEMSEKLYDEIASRVRESYPNSCIVWIEEVLNKGLRNEYEKQRAGGPERQLFHGTHEDAIDSIAAVGFDPSYNRVSAYGIGTYFARDAVYSFSYMRPGREQISYMFLADVFVGKSALGRANYTIPEGVDTAVNNLDSPSIFVTPHRYGAYPKYIIAFHKNAAY